ncbi:uncharacterized protein LOC124436135 [Xenia sp. Carnegie-2017]|uniref:uncharacterized protein LOC124436135 n=1 Tax=Xenia sp. Carnegie-2017 TaxID=2897299 RepID=UPI001F03DC10|nr:uncharacterized protein LOC124436135 [Xenia sp. Carnegie-2017]
MVHVTDETALPGWTGFNTMLIEEIPEVSRVGYLPVINAPPTEYSTINEILKRSKNIAEKLDLQYAVLVFDEAVYSKVQHIRWKEPVYYDKLVVRLGEFHTVMSFLSAVSKLFEDGGLKDLLIESGVVSEGSVKSVLSGKNYNRSMSCHKILYEDKGFRDCIESELFEEICEEYENFIQNASSKSRTFAFWSCNKVKSTGHTL